MKRLAILLLILMGVAVGQNSFEYRQALAVNPTNSGFLPMSNAQVRICTLPASGSPCTPLASIFDINGNPLSVVGGNFGQLTTDIQGRYNFQCTAGNYEAQIASSISNNINNQYEFTCGLSAGGGGGGGLITNIFGTSGQIAVNTVAGVSTVSITNPLHAPGPMDSPGPISVNLGTAYGSVAVTNDPACILPASATGFASVGCPLQTAWGNLLSINSGGGPNVAEPVCPNGFNAVTLPIGIFSAYDATMNCFRLGAPLGQLTIANGLGAINDIVGPSDQPLTIGTPNKNLVLSLGTGILSTTSPASLGPLTVTGAGAGTFQMTQSAALSPCPTNTPNCIGTSVVFFDAPASGVTSHGYTFPATATATPGALFSAGSSTDSGGNTVELVSNFRGLTTTIPSADTISAAGTFATTLSVPNTNMIVGSLITVRAHGIYTTTATVSPLATFQVNAGGTTAMCNAPSAITLPVSQTNVVWNLICTIQINTTGNPGTAMAWGSYEFANNVNGAEVIGNNKLFPNNATGNFITTSAQTVSLQETSTLVAGQTFTLLSISAQVTP